MSNEKKIVLSRPCVEGNGYKGEEGEGVVKIVKYDDEDTVSAIICVSQVEEWMEQDKKMSRKRKGYIGGSLEEMLNVEMDYSPGEKTGGKVLVLETHEPPEPDEPERYLKIRGGVPVQVNGQYVWRVEIYSADATRPDELLDRS